MDKLKKRSDKRLIAPSFFVLKKYNVTKKKMGK